MHKYDLEKPELRMALKMFFIAQTPYKATVCLNKAVAILLDLRLFVTRSFHVWAYIVIGIVVEYGIGDIGATIWQCVPDAGARNKSINATCIDSNKFLDGLRYSKSCDRCHGTSATYNTYHTAADESEREDTARTHISCRVLVSESHQRIYR